MVLLQLFTLTWSCSIPAVFFTTLLIPTTVTHLRESANDVASEREREGEAGKKERPMKGRGSRPPHPDEGDDGDGLCIPTTRLAAMVARVPV
ncbi:hypothetical protein HanRHA438_Chr01g0045751 [Helianthus annuus]|uniref:Uncharacterized protein n=1 Tax=Helianthus annuus TaxID=4232 RepID=A0A251VTW2_HELAN|nr:hypothetical protein HanXRQr2_Chr01g0044751 [Helianthus annuus]KAJ0628695.1 hypothetical protein HanHA89_Chr01g0039241 [Helianthus annuus]KAJ0950108.1 hypothetical protein HanRHA438_Chr01g0045751 [Helianthus annuus]